MDRGFFVISSIFMRYELKHREPTVLKLSYSIFWPIMGGGGGAGGGEQGIGERGSYFRLQV